jgi:RNA polymerase sigma-70 factor (ECF subfamily)
MLNRIRERSLSVRTAELFRQGDPAAFAEVYSKYRESLLAWISARVRDDEIAEEILHDTFLKAFKSRESYSHEFAFSTWLWTIARNTASDWRRRQPESGTRVFSDPDGGHDMIENAPSAGPGPERVLEKKSRLRMLRRVMTHLTRHQRRVIWFRVIHQLSYQEISRRMNLSLSAVKCLAYRSKQVLLQEEIVLAFA